MRVVVTVGAMLVMGVAVGFAQHPPPVPKVPPSTPDGFVGSVPWVPMANLPGDVKEPLESYWVGPYVSEGQSLNQSYVTWFNADGTVKRQAKAAVLEPGFFVRNRAADDPEVVEGVNEDWTISLPKAIGEPGYITSTQDSRVFLHETRPTQGKIAMDVYVHGKLVSTVGPFLSYLGNGAELNEDGSAGFLIWKDAAKTTAQAVTTDANGALKMRVDCGKSVTGLEVAPGGGGVLVSPNPSHEHGPTYFWFGADGSRRSMNFWPAPHLVGWIPKTHEALIETSLGYDEVRYHLVDWDTGKEVWVIPAPLGGHVIATGFTEKLVLFSVAVLSKSRGSWGDNRGEYLEDFSAVSVEDGSMVAKWVGDGRRALDLGRYPSFLAVGGKYYLVSPRAFSELNLDDIAAKRNGWQ